MNHPLRQQDLRQQNLRQHYRPKADRLPDWLHRVWAWF